MIVENLSSKVSWQDLKDIMRRTGEVSYANAHNKRQREGVVEFGSKRDLERALEKFQGYELHGRKINVFPDRNIRSRSRSPLSKKYASHWGKNPLLIQKFTF